MNLAPSSGLASVPNLPPPVTAPPAVPYSAGMPAPTTEGTGGATVSVFADTDVVVGYNIAFDIDMLQAEYTRIGKPMLDFTGKKVVDAFRR